ncbi:tyrosine-type recombinase/integrase [Nocardia carnea]|uniref:tyrosine-type recombinase/integrase n=1 Tax=Nocardia carnea TaxID=37328 RepID=UPI002453A36E|nr:tyrosine-type recombinase/integrase [Nocardia carnea]
MTKRGQVSTPGDSAVFGPGIGSRRTDTGIALRAVTADDVAAEDLLTSGHRALLDQLHEDATAANTTRTYRSPTERFRGWCAEYGYQALPADPDTVAAFLAEAEAERDGDVYRYPTSTLGMWAAAIRKTHLDAGLSDPTTAPTVRKALVSIQKHRTAAGQEATGADPLLADDVRVLVDSITRHSADADWKAQVAACRDIALIVCTFYAGRRRSEIAAIQFGDLTVIADEDDPGRRWIQLRIRGSKTSRTKVEYVALPRSNDPRYCPRCRLLEWLMVVTTHDNMVETAKDRGDTENQRLRSTRQAVIRLVNKLTDRDPHLHHCDRDLPFQRRATAPVWRALEKNTRYLPVDRGPVTDQIVSRVLKKRCREAGFAPEHIARISGHSLRSGFVTQSFRAGVPVEDIMRQTGHKRVETVLRYDKNPIYRNNAVNQIPL